MAGQHRAHSGGRQDVRRAIPIPAAAQEGRLGAGPGTVFSVVVTFHFGTGSSLHVPNTCYPEDWGRIQRGKKPLENPPENPPETKF